MWHCSSIYDTYTIVSNLWPWRAMLNCKASISDQSITLRLYVEGFNQSHLADGANGKVMLNWQNDKRDKQRVKTCIALCCFNSKLWNDKILVWTIEIDAVEWYFACNDVVVGFFLILLSGILIETNYLIELSKFYFGREGVSLLQALNTVRYYMIPTIRPARLLCKFIRDFISVPFSLESMNWVANSAP